MLIVEPRIHSAVSWAV